MDMIRKISSKFKEKIAISTKILYTYASHFTALIFRFFGDFTSHNYYILQTLNENTALDY